MNKLATKIEPNAFYTTDELARLLGVHKNTIRKFKKELKAKKVGRSFKILGKNVINFLGASEVK